MDKENSVLLVGCHHNIVPDATSATDTAKPDQTRQTDKHREWRARIAANAASDPLSVWEQYLEWVKDSEDGQEEYKSALHHCLQELSPEMYKSDIRYLRQWLKYSEFLSIDQQHEMLLYLQQSDIGRDHMLFYLAFATFLEKTRDYEAALKIYTSGVSRGAAPLEKLEEHMAKFNARMARRNRDQCHNPAVKRKQQSTPYKVKDPAPSSAGARTSLSRPRREDMERPGYDESLLSTADAVEPLSFEERRAVKWLNRRDTGKTPVVFCKAGTPRESVPAVPASRWTPPKTEIGEDRAVAKSITAPSPVLATVASQSNTPVATDLLSSLPFVSPLMPAQESSPAATPSLTINTKHAMDEINSMFHDDLESEDLVEPKVPLVPHQALDVIDSISQGGLEHKSPTQAATTAPVPGAVSPMRDSSDVQQRKDTQDASASNEGQHSAEPVSPTSTGNNKKVDIISNPWDRSLREHLLGALQLPLLQWQAVHNDEEDNLDDAFQTLLDFGDSEEFAELGTQAVCVRRLLRRGTDAACFEVDLMDDDTGSEEDSSAVVKVEQPPCLWEFYIGRILHDRLSDPERQGRFVKMKQLHLSQTASFTFMGIGSYGTLQDLITAYNSRGQAMPETVVQFYAMELIQMARDMHGCGILHGDIQPDNLLIRHPSSWDGCSEDPCTWTRAGLQLIDFGRAIDLELMPVGCSFSCDSGTEAQVGRPWTYQVDAYGIASVVHVMLFGEGMSVQRVTDADGAVMYRPSSPLKRHWAVGLWDLFFIALLNHNTTEAPPAWDQILSTFAAHWQSYPAQAKSLQTDLRKQAILLHKD